VRGAHCTLPSTYAMPADESGDIDLEALHTGVSARSRQAARDLPERLQQMLAGA